MDNLAYANKKIITGMITVAVSALLLGLSVGYLLTHTILEKTVLNEMLDEGYVLTKMRQLLLKILPWGKQLILMASC